MSDNNTLDLDNLDSNEPSNVEEVVEDVEPEEVAEEPVAAEEPVVTEEPVEAPVEAPSAPSTEEVVENVKEILSTEPVADNSTDLQERVKVLEERLEKLISNLRKKNICV